MNWKRRRRESRAAWRAMSLMRKRRWRQGLKNYERGRSLALKIDDKDLRAGVADWLAYRATLQMISRKQFDAAEELLRKNENLTERAASRVVGAQKLIQAKDETAARRWLEDAARLVKKTEPDEDAARVALGVVAAFNQFDRAAALEALRVAVSLINKVEDAKFNDERAPLDVKFSGFALSDFTHGTKGFGLSSAIGGFAGTDFETVLQELSEIKQPEARGESIVLLRRKILSAPKPQPIAARKD